MTVRIVQSVGLRTAGRLAQARARRRARMPYSVAWAMTLCSSGRAGVKTGKLLRADRR